MQKKGGRVQKQAHQSIEQATGAALESLGLPATDAGVAAVLLKLASAIDDIDEDGLNPAGKLDNVSIPTYLKYAEALGMTPHSRGALGKPKAQPAVSGSTVAQFRSRHGGRAS